ncbi:beta-ketoacyl-ACP synthase II [Hornefia butyriciproducens]|uniref:beta-ketoacyl-ACP synthase II n=1 Tax=Hornefia butyriciproducens TaxID=2652293 RepID=UPI003D0137A4
MKRRVVITGMGAISPIGNSAEELWSNAEAGVCGIGPVTEYDSTGMKVQVAAEVKDFDPTQYMDKMEARRTARFTQLAIGAADEAFRQSGLAPDDGESYRCGVNISSGIGGLDVIEKEHLRGLKRGFDRVSPLFVPSAICNMAAGVVAIRLGFRGSCTCVLTACASSANAIGEAFRSIRDGYADVMAAGGSESCITDLGMGGFTAMKALSEETDPQRASIPFDAERGGFVMGEGAGIVILEELEHARDRGASILGEIAGYGVSCDAHHMTAPLEDGSGAARSITEAIRDAGIQPEEVGYINAHGTGTPMNDRCETAAVKLAFGEHARRLTMSSTKSMTGHTLGASGALETILTAQTLACQIAPPTINYQVADPDCDLDIVPNKSRKIDTEYAMTNSFGFGGHNASLILRRV